MTEEKPAIIKLCFMCGKEGHIQGTECPMCCSVCAGEIDDAGKCLEFGCIQHNRPNAVGTPPNK